jgi:hypothetical protein
LGNPDKLFRAGRRINLTNVRWPDGAGIYIAVANALERKSPFVPAARSADVAAKVWASHYNAATIKM